LTLSTAKSKIRALLPFATFVPRNSLSNRATKGNLPMSENDVISSQKQILQNQKAILANQTTLKSNQETIKKNQASILKNQAILNTILANQKKILSKLSAK
jgi:hypothetical protein